MTIVHKLGQSNPWSSCNLASCRSYSFHLFTYLAPKMLNVPSLDLAQFKTFVLPCQNAARFTCFLLGWCLSNMRNIFINEPIFSCFLKMRFLPSHSLSKVDVNIPSILHRVVKAQRCLVPILACSWWCLHVILWLVLTFHVPNDHPSTNNYVQWPHHQV